MVKLHRGRGTLPPPARDLHAVTTKKNTRQPRTRGCNEKFLGERNGI
nr:MAG TPA: hypothetical protein [Caudoviricetes sp.]